MSKSDRLDQIIALAFFQGWGRGLIEEAAPGNEIGPPVFMREALADLTSDLIADYKKSCEKEPIALADPLPDHLKWPGPGPTPARWIARDGTIVYRSYKDYCDG